MRGKHANAAANRRAREELEQRATAAEHKAARLEKELAELREASQRQISGLRTELSGARADRDNAAAPALTQAEAKIRALMAERDEATQARDLTEEKWNACRGNLIRILKGMGLTGLEAVEALITSTTSDPAAPLKVAASPNVKNARSVAGAIFIDRAQGRRSAEDPAAVLRRRIATHEEQQKESEGQS